MTAGVVLYRDTTTSPLPQFSRGGQFGGITDGATDNGNLTIPTPAARSGVTLRPRSQAVLTAPEGPDDEADAIPPGVTSAMPALGTYVYAVEGTEEATAFGSRDYPPEMKMTVHRPTRADRELDVEKHELIFDLEFSEDHEEREIVSFRKDGVSFTYEAGSISFGITQTSEASYEPPMIQVPAKLRPGQTVQGTTRAYSPDGEQVRTEDWNVTVEGRDTIEVLDERVATWIVRIDRQTRPGSDDQVTRSRRYWFSPSHAIWVKWEETMSGTRDVGLGSFDYSTEFTATLDRINRL